MHQKQPVPNPGSYAFPACHRLGKVNSAPQQPLRRSLSAKLHNKSQHFAAKLHAKRHKMDEHAHLWAANQLHRTTPRVPFHASSASHEIPRNPLFEWTEIEYRFHLHSKQNSSSPAGKNTAKKAHLTNAEHEETLNHQTFRPVTVSFPLSFPASRAWGGPVKLSQTWKDAKSSGNHMALIPL